MCTATDTDIDRSTYVKKCRIRIGCRRQQSSTRSQVTFDVVDGTRTQLFDRLKHLYALPVQHLPRSRRSRSQLTRTRCLCLYNYRSPSLSLPVSISITPRLPFSTHDLARLLPPCIRSAHSHPLLVWSRQTLQTNRRIRLHMTFECLQGRHEAVRHVRSACCSRTQAQILNWLFADRTNLIKFNHFRSDRRGAPFNYTQTAN
jgi:hypothetical protein